MEPIGERLSGRREELRLTLREAEAATRIRLRYLEAMEENRFDDLPGDVFAKGFLRAYATYLGLDGAAIVEDFKAVRPSGDAAAAGIAVPASAAGRPRRRRRRSGRRWAVLVVLALFAAAAVALAHLRPPAPQTAPSGHAAPTPAAGRATRPAASVAPPAPPAAAAAKPRIVPGAPSGTLLPFTVAGSSAVAVRASFTGLCWVRVWIDGVQQQPDRTLRPGQSAVWRGSHSVRILLGNPPAAHLTVDGVSLGPIDTRNPRTVSFTLGAS